MRIWEITGQGLIGPRKPQKPRKPTTPQHGSVPALSPEQSRARAEKQTKATRKVQDVKASNAIRLQAAQRAASSL